LTGLIELTRLTVGRVNWVDRSTGLTKLIGLTEFKIRRVDTVDRVKVTQLKS